MKKTLIGLFVLTIVHVILAVDRINLRIDDVYISSRVAYNLLHGNGMVFNPGERIEAISNPTWVWLVSGVCALLGRTEPMSIITTTKVTGLVLSCATLVLFFFLVRLALHQLWAAFVFALMYAAQPFVATYAIAGLENPLVNLLMVSWLFCCTMFFRGSQTRYLVFACMSIGVLSISRPEGVIYLVGAFAPLLIVPKTFHANRPRMMQGAVIATSIFLGMLAWRTMYYGSLVPNTVFAKNSPSIRVFVSGCEYVALFIASSLSFYIPVIFLRDEKSRRVEEWNHRSIVLVCAMVLAQLMFVIYAGGDWMAGSRLLLVVFPIVIYCIASFSFISSSELKWHKHIVVLVLVMMIGSGVVIGRKLLKVYQANDSGWRESPWVFLPPSYMDVARRLKAIAPPNSKVLIGELGVVPLFNPELKFTDFQGLVNLHVARDLEGEHFKRLDAEYFAKLDYNYFVVLSVAVREDGGKVEVSTDNEQINQVLRQRGFAARHRMVYHNEDGAIFERMEE